MMQATMTGNFQDTMPSRNPFAELSTSYENSDDQDFILREINKLTQHDNIYFLDFLKPKPNTPPLIAELQEILEEHDEWKEEEGIEIIEESVNYAILFAKKSIYPNQLPEPHIEVHADGEIAFTWRKKDKGIINIAFNKEGVATWAAYLPLIEETNKGRFKVDNGIAYPVKHLIKLITDSSEDDHLAT